METKQKVLTPNQIQTFQDNGLLVVPNILSPDQVKASKLKLHQTLLKYGVDTNDLKSTGHNLVKLSSTNGAGGVLDLFYPGFKLDIATNETLFRATCELWETSFRNGSMHEKNTNIEDWKEHPFENFDCSKGYAYIDRIGFRLPTALAEDIGQSIATQQQENETLVSTKKKKKRSKMAIQRSLTPHLDCCPDTISSSSNKKKWRPIQCFVSLTDNLQPNTGGFEAVRGGFHKEFNNWAATRQNTILQKKGVTIAEVPPPCVGEYTHIRPKEDADVMKRVEHIPVSSGSAVFWDNRLPHANAYKNEGDDVRIVVYCSFLPDVEINRVYAKKQLEDFTHGRIPRDQWIERESSNSQSNEENVDEDNRRIGIYEEFHDENYSFSSTGRKLMMIDEW